MCLPVDVCVRAMCTSMSVCMCNVHECVHVQCARVCVCVPGENVYQMADRFEFVSCTTSPSLFI